MTYRKNVYSLKTIPSILGLDLHSFKILTSFLASVGRIFSVKHDLSMVRERHIQTARQTRWMEIWCTCSSLPPNLSLMDVNCVKVML